MNVIRVETDTAKRTRYKGEFAHLASWKREFIGELRVKNKLAAAIVQGHVKVHKEASLTTAIYTCLMGVMTHFMLAVTAIMAVGSTEANNAIDRQVYVQKHKPYYKYIVRIALDETLSTGDKEQSKTT